MVNHAHEQQSNSAELLNASTDVSLPGKIMNSFSLHWSEVLCDV